MARRTMIMVKRTYLNIAILTLVTALVWMMITLYGAVTSTSEIEVDATIKSPIKPSFDEEVFNAIVGRENLSNLSFEPPAPSVSAITINEVVPAEAVSEPESSTTEETVVVENPETL